MTTVLPAPLESAAQWVAERGLVVPTVFALELHRPVRNIAAHAVLAGTPLIAPLLGLQRCQELAAMLQDPVLFEAFLDRLEALAREDRAA
ncbi:MAG: hypothetical protein IT204_04305 [Fimbriimonadaceae bacterium]|nr:hypothetical protein [Fimbriimonadaceae bacterium]